jgi:hypothetical protein
MVTVSNKEGVEKPAVLIKVPQALLIAFAAALLGAGGGQLPAVLGQSGPSPEKIEAIAENVKAIQSKLDDALGQLTQVRERLSRMEGQADRAERTRERMNDPYR